MITMLSTIKETKSYLKRLNFSQEKKDKIKAYQKQWRESNKDYSRNYYHILTKDQIKKRKEYAGNYQQKLINAKT